MKPWTLITHNQYDKDWQTAPESILQHVAPWHCAEAPPPAVSGLSLITCRAHSDGRTKLPSADSRWLSKQVALTSATKQRKTEPDTPGCSFCIIVSIVYIYLWSIYLSIHPFIYLYYLSLILCSVLFVDQGGQNPSSRLHPGHAWLLRLCHLLWGPTQVPASISCQDKVPGQTGGSILPQQLPEITEIA